jgi:hypothetical protein
MAHMDPSLVFSCSGFAGPSATMEPEREPVNTHSLVDE